MRFSKGNTLVASTYAHLRIKRKQALYRLTSMKRFLTYLKTSINTYCTLEKRKISHISKFEITANNAFCKQLKIFTRKMIKIKIIPGCK